MHAVIITFPGHFFQTHLTVDSVARHYPEIEHITFVLDDVDAGPWTQYQQDFASAMQDRCRVPHRYILVSDLDPINTCVAGWWRQQLVKMTLDQILPDQRWFVVDGDVIFDTRCEIQDRLPISYSFNAATNWGKMSMAYVRDVLGIEKGYLEEGNRAAVTSPVPFRYLDRDLLVRLRQHVSHRFDKDFVRCHLDWFENQTIVADIDPPNRWVMTEWELIESFRRHVLGVQLPFAEVGSGYALDIDTSDKQEGKNLFRHAYQRDTEIGREWFRYLTIDADEITWQRSESWYRCREPRRCQ